MPPRRHSMHNLPTSTKSKQFQQRDPATVQRLISSTTEEAIRSKPKRLDRSLTRIPTLLVSDGVIWLLGVVL